MNKNVKLSFNIIILLFSLFQIILDFIFDGQTSAVYTYLVISSLYSVLLLTAGIFNLVYFKKNNFWLNLALNVIAPISAHTFFHNAKVFLPLFSAGGITVIWIIDLIFYILTIAAFISFLIACIKKKFDFSFPYFSLIKDNTSNIYRIIDISVFCSLFLLNLFLPLAEYGSKSITIYQNSIFIVGMILYASLFIPLILKVLPHFIFTTVTFSTFLVFFYILMDLKSIQMIIMSILAITICVFSLLSYSYRYAHNKEALDKIRFHQLFWVSIFILSNFIVFNSNLNLHLISLSVIIFMYLILFLFPYLLKKRENKNN